MKRITPKPLTCLLLLCLCKTSLYAQLGIQLNGGIMNYGGDLQAKVYTLNQSELTGGVALLYGFNNFFLRAGFNYGSVQADDAKSKIAYRNLSFKSNISDVNLSLGYDIKLHEDSKLIPYVFAGVGMYHYNPYTYYDSQKIYLRPLSTEGEGLSIYPNKKFYSLTNVEVPLGVGVKYKIAPDFLLGIEFNSRLIFTDYLDDVSETYPDETELFKERGQLAVNLSYRGNQVDPTTTFPSGRLRGNPHHNDNFYSSVITLTYIFPQSKSFGGVSGHGRHEASVNCPKKIH